MNSILHPMSPAIYLVLSLKWETCLDDDVRLLISNADRRIISNRQELIIVSLGSRATYLGHRIEIVVIDSKQCYIVRVNYFLVWFYTNSSYIDSFTYMPSHE